MTVPDFPTAPEDVSQGIRAEVVRVMRGLMYRGSPLARPEPAERCTPVTPRQWWMAYDDSCFELTCSQLDDAAASLLEIRRVPVPLVRRRLPGLVSGLVAAYGRIKDIEGDLGRFSPPESEAGLAELVCKVAEACYEFTAAILECAVGGLDAAIWTSAIDIRCQRDRMLGSIDLPACELRSDIGPS